MTKLTSVPAEKTPVAQFVDRIPEHCRMHALGLMMTEGDASTRIAMSLFDAESPDDLFGESTVSKWDVGRVLTVINIRSLNASDFDEGSPVYAVVDAVDVDGNPQVVVVGGEQVVVQLVKASAEGWLPTPPLLMTEVQTGNNFYVRKLRKVQAEENF